MSDSELNPYQTWLGLEHDSPNHYELLGLSPRESDATTISEAASRVRRQVCAIRPKAEQTSVWSDLLSEIETAESVLTNDAQRAQYNDSIGLEAETEEPEEESIPMALPVSAPPPPSAPAPQGPATQAPSQPPSQPIPPTGNAPAGHPPPSYPATGYPPPGYAPAYPAAAAPVGTPVSAPMPAPTSAPMPGVPDPMAPVGQSSTPAPAVASAPMKPPAMPGEPAPHVGAKASSASRKLRQRKQSARNMPVYLAIGAVGMLTLAGVIIMLNGSKPRGPEPTVANPNTPAAQPAPQAKPKQKPGPTEVAVASPNSRTEKNRPEPEPEPMPEPMPVPQPDPEPMPEPKPEPEPEPKPEPMPEPEPTATPDQIAALNQAMQKIRDELGRANFATAKTLLSSAAELPGATDQKMQLQRLDNASELIQQFHEGVDRSLAELKAVDTLEVGPTQVAIVEIRPDELVLKVDGRNRTYPRNNMPALLALTLADRVMPSSEGVNQVAKAMYLAVHQQRTASVLTKSKELLQEGLRAGANAESLVAFLDDTYAAAGANPTVTPLPEMPEPTRPPTAEEVAKLTEVLGKVEEDLGKGNIAGATKRLESVAVAPGTAAQRESVARLTKAAAYLAEFHAAMQQATDELKADDDVALTASVNVKVLQVTKDKLRIELTGGTQKTIDRTEMPTALAVQLAKRKLEDNPKSKVLSALYVIFNPKSTSKAREQAKGWLEEAGQDGDLLPLFERLTEE